MNLQLIAACGPTLLELFRGTSCTDFLLEKAGLPITPEKCSKMRNIPANWPGLVRVWFWRGCEILREERLGALE